MKYLSRNLFLTTHLLNFRLRKGHCIVRNNYKWNIEPCHYLFQEIEDFILISFIQFYYICPSSKVSHCSKNPFMSITRWRIHHSNEIQPPLNERLIHLNWVQWKNCQLLLAGEKGTFLAFPHLKMGIFEQIWPILTGPHDFGSSFSHKVMSSR